MKARIFSGALLLVTGTAAATTLLDEDFEAANPPSGWTLSQNTPSVGWEFGTSLGSGSFSIPAHTVYAASNDDEHDNSSTLQNLADRDRLISPPLDLSAYGPLSASISLTFSYVQPSTLGSTGSIEVSVDGGPFEEVSELTPTLSWAAAEVDMSSYAGKSNVRIAFRHNDHAGWGDGFAIDDVLIETAPIKRAVLEQFVGAWCGFCPDGYIYSRQIAAAEPRLIVVADHDADSMAIPAGNDLAAFYSPAYPQAMVDRHHGNGQAGVVISRSAWAVAVGNRLAEQASAEVRLANVTYNEVSRELSADTRITFHADDAGDLRVNLWVVEDGVTGVGSGYDQTNYYNGTAGHPYEGAGDPIVGFPHDGTVRAMVGGAWGSAGQIPAVVSAGDTYSTNFRYILGPGEDPVSIRLVGTVSRFGANVDARSIINANQTRLITRLFKDGFEPEP